MDILRLNTFIAQDILVIFYYFMAIFVPLLLWLARPYILKKIFFLKVLEGSVKDYYRALNARQKLLVFITFIFLFLCSELCLRMMFKAMIGYFDMHNYLYEISQKLNEKYERIFCIWRKSAWL